MVKNPPAKAGDTGSSPGPGKSAEQLSLCATATEPACLEPVLRNRRNHHSEKPAHRDEE